MSNQGISGPLPPAHLHPAKQHRRTALHPPPPAQAAKACTPKPPPAHRHTPRPAPLPSDTTPIITWHDAGSGLWTGLGRVVHFFQGSQDASLDMVNPIKIYEGLNAFGEQEGAIYFPDADGHMADGDAFAKKLGHDFLDGLNPFDKPSAYATG